MNTENETLWAHHMPRAPRFIFVGNLSHRRRQSQASGGQPPSPYLLIFSRIALEHKFTVFVFAEYSSSLYYGLSSHEPQILNALHFILKLMYGPAHHLSFPSLRIAFKIENMS